MPSHQRTLYEQVPRFLPGRQFMFMNHGYAGGRLNLKLESTLSLQETHIGLLMRVLGKTSCRGKRVLEVGCGRGGNCHVIARYLHPREVVGMDYSVGNVALCRRLWRGDGVTFQRGDAERIPLRDEAFDVVVNIESSHCYRDVTRFYREVYRVLKPGGTFCYADCFVGRGMAAYDAELERAGFRIRSSADITSGVIRALRRNRRNLERTLLDSMDGSLESFRYAVRIIEGVSFEALQGYERKGHVYKTWLLRKPA